MSKRFFDRKVTEFHELRMGSMTMDAISTGIEPKVAEGSLPGNNKNTFEERTGLLLFQEGSLTKY